MNTLSLSVSNPSRSKGSSLRSSVKPSLSRPCFRTSNGPHSVHPVAMSVKTSVCTKLPLAEGPLCATRSASTKPGGGSCQSAKVRTGTLRRTAEDGAVRRRGRASYSSSGGAILRPHYLLLGPCEHACSQQALDLRVQ